MKMAKRRMITEEKFDVSLWQPRTEMGRMVKEGKITSISEILRKGQRPREPEIVDALVPNLEEEVLGIASVQRMHKSGRRAKFRIVAVVGNHNGIVGVAHASVREIGPAIRKAVIKAKLNIIEVARGCGSWECGCGRPHSIPFEVSGQSSSVQVNIKPAPRGLGIAAAKVPKIILDLAGVKDVWMQSRGQTETTINFALATFDALKETTKMALRESRRGIVAGKAGEVSG